MLLREKVEEGKKFSYYGKVQSMRQRGYFRHGV